MWDVVVVGAGISGLTAAQALVQAGYSVQIVDKSRGLGGRIATRRIEGGVVDHGCRFLQPFTTLEATWLSEALAQRWLQPWTPQVFELTEHGRPLRRADPTPYYIAPNGMSSLAKALAQGLAIERECRVTQVNPTSQGWQIQAELGAEGHTSLTARTVILAMPAPQISPLLASAALDLPDLNAWLDPIQAVEFEPVITVMAGYGPGTVPALAEALDPTQTTTKGWMVFGDRHAVLRWAALDSSKRSQPSYPVLVLHSSAEFAAAHLEVADLQPPGQALLSTAATHLGSWMASPDWMQVHRWRYGFVKNPHPASVLSTSAVPTLVGCGDWCNGSGVEEAILAGRAAATHLTQWLSAHP